MSRKKKSKLLQAIEYAAYRLVAGMVGRASDERVDRWGARLGALAGKVVRRRDRLAMRNLRSAFPEKSPAELRAILDECWRHFGRETLQYIKLQQMTLDQIAQRCEFVNRHFLDEAIALDKGVILMTAHYGGWEIAGLALTTIVENLHTVTRALDNEYLERDVLRFRTQTGARMIDRRQAARPLMKALNQKAAVGILPDQAVLAREGVLVPFLGRPAWTTPAPAKLALRLGSPLVFVFCIPDKTRHRLEFEEPIRVDRLTEDERDPVALTTRINDVISGRIAAHPELWLWMHDRWKGTGESEVANG